MANTVTLLVNGIGTRKEATANAAITPGHLVELMTTGNIRVHATAGANAQKSFALENELEGEEMTVAYAANDLAFYSVFKTGDRVNALLNNGESVAIGAPLESAGNGALQAHTLGSAAVVEAPNSIVGYALEAVDMSDSSAADPSGRIAIEIA
jgi:hypothetical protein